MRAWGGHAPMPDAGMRITIAVPVGRACESAWPCAAATPAPSGPPRGFGRSPRAWDGPGATAKASILRTVLRRTLKRHAVPRMLAPRPSERGRPVRGTPREHSFASPGRHARARRRQQRGYALAPPRSDHPAASVGRFLIRWRLCTGRLARPRSGQRPPEADPCAAMWRRVGPLCVIRSTRQPGMGRSVFMPGSVDAGTQPTCASPGAPGPASSPWSGRSGRALGLERLRVTWVQPRSVAELVPAPIEVTARPGAPPPRPCGRDRPSE